MTTWPNFFLVGVEKAGVKLIRTVTIVAKNIPKVTKLVFC